MNFKRSGSKAHGGVARLIVNLAGDGNSAGRRIGRCMEPALDDKTAAEDTQSIAPDFQRLGFGVLHRGRVKWPSRPFERERDDVLAIRFVAVDMEAGQSHHAQLFGDACAALDDNLISRLNGYLILLRCCRYRQACADE